MSSFGKCIKRKRQERNWTQTEFGAKIGINTSAISRIENGSQKFSKSKLEKLSQLLKVNRQEIRDKFFADKFATEAKKYGCSKSIFKIAEEAAMFLRSQTPKKHYNEEKIY